MVMMCNKSIDQWININTDSSSSKHSVPPKNKKMRMYCCSCSINLKYCHCVFAAFPLTCVCLSLLPPQLDVQKVGWHCVVSTYFISTDYLLDITWPEPRSYHPVKHDLSLCLCICSADFKSGDSHIVPQIKKDHHGWIVRRCVCLWNYHCNLKIPEQNGLLFC